MKGESSRDDEASTNEGAIRCLVRPTHPAADTTALTLVATEPSAGLSPTGVVRLRGLPRDPYEGAQALLDRLPRQGRT
jgi:hypothetical protein